VDAVDKDGNLFSATPSSGWLLCGADPRRERYIFGWSYQNRNRAI
jgi:hypothetical protein